ncbi:MAG TPA: hypothetical protein EYG81_02325 [Archaeoglobus profundus]|nr:hypothetical protein [Archaeoglobus profundus]
MITLRHLLKICRARSCFEFGRHLNILSNIKLYRIKASKAKWCFLDVDYVNLDYTRMGRGIR